MRDLSSRKQKGRKQLRPFCFLDYFSPVNNYLGLYLEPLRIDLASIFNRSGILVFGLRSI